MASKKPLPIPRRVLFGNPSKIEVKISPNGKYLSYIAPSDGVLNVYIAPINNRSKACQITNEKVRGIRSYYWAYNSEQIIYEQDTDGDENIHLYAVNVLTHEFMNLTPYPGAKASALKGSLKHPDNLLISINNRTSEYFDVYNCNTKTGALTPVYFNNSYIRFIADNDLRLRFGVRMDGYGRSIDKFTEGEAEKFISLDVENIHTNIAGIDHTGDKIYLIDSRPYDTSSLFLMDIQSQTLDLLYRDERADISHVWISEQTGMLNGVSTCYDKESLHTTNSVVAEHLQTLQTGHDLEEIFVISETSDNTWWIVRYEGDISGIRYYLYNTELRKNSFLFEAKPELNPYDLVRMHPTQIKTRDGLTLVSYLSLPLEIFNKESLHHNINSIKSPVPLILCVHGGPTARDHWGYHSIHQLLANRGYAVLSVNYRGSTGFGKSFIAAGNGEWAGKMQDDLLDAVKWAIDQGITTKDKIAIYGGSYGGYATLVGLTMTPEVFACGIDLVGPSNLLTLLESCPPYWKPIRKFWEMLMGGNSETPEGREILAKKSPLTYAKNIKRPLLIGHGANDARVKQAESDQIVATMLENNIPVTYAIYPDEGHGFARPENRISFYALVENFLVKTFPQQRAEPLGDAFCGSSLQIKCGEKEVVAR